MTLDKSSQIMEPIVDNVVKASKTKRISKKVDKVTDVPIVDVPMDTESSTEVKDTDTESVEVKDVNKPIVSIVSVEQSFDAIITEMVEEAQNKSDSSIELKNKFMKNLLKDIKNLKKQVLILHKKKKVKTVKIRKTDVCSGLQQQKPIIDELITFFDLKTNTSSRVEATKLISKYIKDNNLQNPENKKIIVIDDKLRALIKYDDVHVLTYSTLQKYISNLFKQVE